LVAERVRAHGLGGRVTIGHVTTLAAMPSDEQARALDLLAESGIALILLPVTDLYLAGHGQPGSRSLAPLARARAAGVRVALANNNLQNPFSPFGNGSLLQAAWLTGIIERAADSRTRQWLFEAVTSEPAAILGLPAHGPSLGALAHLVLVDAPSIDDVMLSAAPVLATVHSSRVVHALLGPTAD
jgi:cytosine/creatinine deaminase